MQCSNLLVETVTGIIEIFSISDLHADVLIATLFFDLLIFFLDALLAELAGLEVEVGCNGNLEDAEANRAGESVLVGKIVGLLADGGAVLIHGSALFLGSHAALDGEFLGINGGGLAVLGNEDGHDDALEESLEDVDHETLLEEVLDRILVVVVVVAEHPRAKQVNDVARYGDVDEANNGGESGGICQAAEDEDDATAVSEQHQNSKDLHSVLDGNAEAALVHLLVVGSRVSFLHI